MSLVTATIQDFLCIGILIPFCIIFPPGEGYIYLEGFWTMIASMIFSLAATVLISLDLNRTPHFRLSGSGVTQKQRILIAEAMALCLYLAFGALAFVYIERWRPLDALFFVMVTITTIGFGDRVPETPGGRVFAIFYAIGGIVLLALVVNSIRYVILEDLHGELAVRARERKAKRHARRLEQRTREEANRQRLQDTLRQTHRMGSASGVGESTHTFPRYFSLPYGNHLRLPTLFMGDAEARQSEPVDQQGICPDTKSNDDNRMEVIEILNEAPIRELSGSRMHNNDRGGTNILPSECSSADQRNTADSPHGTPRHMASGYYQRQHLGDTRWWSKLAIFKHKPPQTAPYLTPEEQRKADREEAEKETMREYQIRLWSSAMTFLFFWVIGAVIFTFVESWDFGSAMYFGVVAFSTIGYGDLVPKTIAGRAIFLSYCLLGVVTMTSLASLIAEVLSKRMRKHVVRTQLRRVERLEAFEDERNSRLRNNLDIEQAEHQGSGSDNGSQDGHLQALNGPEELDASADSDTCQGSLRRLVKVSKDLDKALQQVLSGLDYTMDDSCRASPLPVATPSAIVDYLEKEEGDSNIYLSPSISRDITSTSSIHRTMRPMLQVHRQRLEGRSSTFHGTNGGMIDDGSKMTIMDWPSRAGTPTPRSGTPTQSSPKPARRQVTLPTLSPQASISPSYPTYQRNRNDNATAPVQWLHLVKYVKQFKALTVACEEALQKVAEWEASEKKLRKRRSQAYRHQTQLLQERLRQLQGHETPDTIDQEHEEEELEDLNWEEEGSNGDEEDEALNQRRSVIVATLLGSENPRRDHGRGRSMSTAMSQSVPAGQDIALAARQQRSQQVDRDSYPPINASRL
ncbi:hypothetical protein BGX31_001811 [Mortierella sp. GBA43]|nr:hypothetical protein BGX31_001811 [Mortierella sp. GBA43]